MTSSWVICGVLAMFAFAVVNAGHYECFNEKDASDYRGELKVTIHGNDCQAWTSQEPHQHSVTPENYKNSGLGNHTYCRNPDDEPGGAWCFTTDPDHRWAYCNLGPVAKFDCDEEIPVEDKDYFKANGKKEIQKALKDNDKRKENIAKNVILMIGDGLDTVTATASRIKKKGVNGELTIESLPNLGMLRTYNCDNQVPDSGSAATALFSGVKAPADTLGVDCTAEYGNCSTVEAASVQSVLNDFIKAERSTGIVTTASITDGTPAALYAHTANRKWEKDADLPKDSECEDIGAQFLEHTEKVNVILGGGRANLLPVNVRDPEYRDIRGSRTDDRNIIREWVRAHSNDDAEYVWNLRDFQDVDPGNTDYLLGLFEPGNMHYETDRGSDEALEPSIVAMAKKALHILQKNDKGYFLMIEGGQIDDAHHEGKAKKALFDTLAFDVALSKILEMVDLKDTLVIVTSDHAQALNFAGYSSRDNPITGLNDDPYEMEEFTTLQYGTGPGGFPGVSEPWRDDPEYVYQASVATNSSNHGGQDVPVYAAGPMAHLFHKTHDQTFVAHAIRMAACLGDYEDACSRTPRGQKPRKIQ